MLSRQISSIDPAWRAPFVERSLGMLIAGGFWWTVLFDSLAIATLVVSINLIADGFQEALDG